MDTVGLACPANSVEIIGTFDLLKNVAQFVNLLFVMGVCMINSDVSLIIILNLCQNVQH